MVSVRKAAIGSAASSEAIHLSPAGLWACLAVALMGCAAALGTGAAAQQPTEDRAALLRSLPRVTELPSGYRAVGELAGRGHFYALAGPPVFRIDDGGAHHTGAANTAAWATMAAKGMKGHGTQGVLYRVEDGAITAAGYLIRQSDLVAGKSFRGLTFRELPFPAAQSLTIDLVKGATADGNRYLWLWHFLPQQGQVRPMLPAGELPPVTSLPSRFTVIGADVHPKAFYPRMGRHRRDGSSPGRRLPTAARDESVLYGEAAGKLIFIEYVFSHQDFAAGVSWPAMPLNGVPVPPIDNVHIMHYAATPDASENFTAHMYFIAEERYLAWETEPPSL
jgi:hypothetical protein